ncbi:MAG: hypothetical protein QM715_13310 [Nibricoccus sp.]
MSCEPLIALVLPTHANGFAVVAIAFTAVIAIPAGYLFGLLREKMSAKISKKSN